MRLPEKPRQSSALWLLIVTYAAVGFSIYFSLGVVAKHGLGLTPLIFLLAGVLFVLTALTYFEGSAMLRERGGSSSYARHAFNELIAFVAGWVILLDYLIVIALAVLSVPHYLRPVTGDLDGTFWMTAVIGSVVLYIAALNWLDVPARRRPRFIVVLAAGDLLIQVVIVVVGLFVVMDPDALTRHVDLWTSPGLEDAIYAVVVATLAYAGIEAMANIAPDLDLNPRRFTRVVTRSIWLVPVLYALMAAVALMAVPVYEGATGPETRLGTTFIEAPVLGVVEAFRPHWLSQALQWTVGLVAAATLVWAANTAMLGVSRHVYALAVNRQIPSWLGQLDRRYETPYKAIVICAVVVFGLALTGDVEMLAGVYAFGATLAITIGHLSIIRLRRTMPDAPRPFRAPLNLGRRPGRFPLSAGIGALLSTLALISVLAFHDSARWVGLGWLAVGLAGYVVYRLGFEQVSLTERVTVDAHALTRPRVTIEFHRILVPIFGTPLDDDIVSTAGRMAAEADPGRGGEGAEVIILQLTEVPLTRAIEDPVPAEEEVEAVRAVARAEDVAGEYESVAVSVERARVRRQGTGIVAAARRLGVDAIVMGAEPPSPIRGGARLGGIGDYRPAEIGPVTAYVLRRAPCRVLLTAPPEDPAAVAAGDRGGAESAGSDERS